MCVGDKGGDEAGKRGCFLSVWTSFSFDFLLIFYFIEMFLESRLILMGSFDFVKFSI